ncbi:hypothetical protein FVE85_1440 [Porphyridium purpureum]|uniref:Uncharacterized protein n=1 Tax=Porphyridium purpureum TaxID=35688 RepID=A0A5J4YVI5_PORPP|nr:hypothetical protein FVE85_1440 [Porphyridium purpureum]|eukprot:POR7030..scf209_3
MVGKASRSQALRGKRRANQKNEQQLGTKVERAVERFDGPVYGVITVLRTDPPGEKGASLILDEACCLIGRDERCDVQIRRKDVSKLHAMISVDPASKAARIKVMSEDLVMAVNENILGPGQEVALINGDKLWISNRCFVFTSAHEIMTKDAQPAVEQASSLNIAEDTVAKSTERRRNSLLVSDELDALKSVRACLSAPATERRRSLPAMNHEDAPRRLSLPATSMSAQVPGANAQNIFQASMAFVDPRQAKGSKRPTKSEKRAAKEKPELHTPDLQCGDAASSGKAAAEHGSNADDFMENGNSDTPTSAPPGSVPRVYKAQTFSWMHRTVDRIEKRHTFLKKGSGLRARGSAVIGTHKDCAAVLATQAKRKSVAFSSMLELEQGPHYSPASVRVAGRASQVRSRVMSMLPTLRRSLFSEQPEGNAGKPSSSAPLQPPPVQTAAEPSRSRLERISGAFSPMKGLFGSFRSISPSASETSDDSMTTKAPEQEPTLGVEPGTMTMSEDSRGDETKENDEQPISAACAEETMNEGTLREGGEPLHPPEMNAGESTPTIAARESSDSHCPSTKVRAEMSTMKVAELRLFLKELSLSTVGKKAALVERAVEASVKRDGCVASRTIDFDQSPSPPLEKQDASSGDGTETNEPQAEEAAHGDAGVVTISSAAKERKMTELSSMKVLQLRSALKSHGIDSSGLKKDLVCRLFEFEVAQGEGSTKGEDECSSVDHQNTRPADNAAEQHRPVAKPCERHDYPPRSSLADISSCMSSPRDQEDVSRAVSSAASAPSSAAKAAPTFSQRARRRASMAL